MATECLGGDENVRQRELLDNVIGQLRGMQHLAASLSAEAERVIARLETVADDTARLVAMEARLQGLEWRWLSVERRMGDAELHTRPIGGFDAKDTAVLR